MFQEARQTIRIWTLSPRRGIFSLSNDEKKNVTQNTPYPVYVWYKVHLMCDQVPCQWSDVGLTVTVISVILPVTQHQHLLTGKWLTRWTSNNTLLQLSNPLHPHLEGGSHPMVTQACSKLEQIWPPINYWGHISLDKEAKSWKQCNPPSWQHHTPPAWDLWQWIICSDSPVVPCWTLSPHHATAWPELCCLAHVSEESCQVTTQASVPASSGQCLGTREQPVSGQCAKNVISESGHWRGQDWWSGGGGGSVHWRLLAADLSGTGYTGH